MSEKDFNSGYSIQKDYPVSNKALGIDEMIPVRRVDGIGTYGTPMIDYEAKISRLQEQLEAVTRELEIWQTVKHSSYWKARAEAAEARVARLEADNERLTNNTNRFPELMGRIKAEKSQPLKHRIAAILAAIEAMPDGFGNYQWQAEERQLFGEKWVRSVAGDNGQGTGRQAIAAVPSHLSGVAPYIAAANPDTILMLIAALDVKGAG